LVLVLGEGLYQSENLPLFLLVLVGDFLATLALYIPYSLLPETAMAHGISQVPQQTLWIRLKRSGFLSIFMRFVFLATLALYIPYSLLPETAMAHGISQVPQQNSVDKI
jgi:hypothetical protein